MVEYKIAKEFYPDGREGMVRITKSYTFPLSDLVIDELPKSCYQCPVGYMTCPDHPCGRNVPWTDIDYQQRPPTCKLRTLYEYLKGERHEQE